MPGMSEANRLVKWKAASQPPLYLFIYLFIYLPKYSYFTVDLINWKAMADTHAFYGQPQTDISTLNDCLSRCQADTTCRGVDWDKDNQCWFHLDTYPDAVYGKGVTLFIKQDSSKSLEHFLYIIVIIIIIIINTVTSA